MSIKMPISTIHPWFGRKIGHAVFDEQNQFVLSEKGKPDRSHSIQELQSVQWEPDTMPNRLMRQPLKAFFVTLAVMFVVFLITALLSGKSLSLPRVAGGTVGLTLFLIFGKVHRARFSFANGDSAVLSISKKFAKEIHTLKPGIGPAP